MTSGPPNAPGAHDGASEPGVLRVALCQLDLRVGGLRSNVEAMALAYERADAAGCDVALFPELAVCGYPPEDLLLKAGFVADGAESLEALARRVTGRCAAVVGWVEGDRRPGADPHDATDGPWNAAAVLHDGRIVGSYRKQALPNYGVFDEKRYFDPGSPDQPLYRIGGVVCAVTVCEDVWVAGGPAVRAAHRGAQVVLNVNASPFQAGKQDLREAMLLERQAEAGVPIVYLNVVGGQDELVFDGGSVVVDDGEVVARAPRFAVSELVLDVAVPAAPQVDDDTPLAVVAVSEPADPAARRAGGRAEAVIESSPRGPEEIWDALVLGTRDYVAKNGFTDVVLGLSGGVDSALVATIAADALGPEHVHVVLMPSRYSSDHSVTDADRLAANLGVDARTIAIEPAHAAFAELLAPSFGERPPDLTEENLQSRIRGVLLMALSNKFGWLVLTTGNKSETAVGYSTLYGDSAGGLAVIKDVPKLLVYELCRWRNERAGTDLIPEQILTKAPSAELRPDQRDDQSLPPYEVLDPLIEAYVDGDRTIEELVDAGHDEAMVRRIARLVDLAEYKRRQSPPGIRISQKAFGRDRRLPITNAAEAPPAPVTAQEA
ncbi:NAD+ synthase [Dermatobacter hominis]|uniref:NAD+ synthase n=1 Tax=Dermatobacter hominis TaxID=2884263 RepID=UPI001D1058C7|nr:NAD+ synthase [Dermatobacter hominis]UDY34412.1 NAD+ synthase [Dermatobacter hominis]